MSKISTMGHRFIDQKGRHLIFRGINIVHKGHMERGKINYIPSWDEDMFKNFREWGFNVVRLGLIWDAVEPEPGIYDETYLGWVGRMLDLCEKHGIHVFLDMHQDLYSSLYSDGAPEWATIAEGKAHIEGELWSDAYIFSEAVKTAFDNFWANAPAPDGIGLQDHYARMWVHIAKLFRGHGALIGYDFLNEPYPGSVGTAIFGALMNALAEAMSKITGMEYGLKDMIAVFSDQGKKLKVLDLLEDKKLYRAIAKKVESQVAEFDRGVLDAFYQKISEAVRVIDSNSIIMRENSYFSNIGIECRAKAISLDGKRDLRQAYSPHGYDLVVDTEAMQFASNNRIDVIFEAHRRTQMNMGVPVIVGEWGAHGGYGKGLYHLNHILDIFDRYLWSSTYWCYTDDFHKAPALNILRRAYPMAVCGEILSFKYDGDKGIFTMEWDEMGGSEPSLIYLPARTFKMEPEVNFLAQDVGKGSIVTLEPTGEKRTLTIFLG